jgi:tRNA threonylcarbamoyladenosine biosynthesis protein TsaE
MTKRNGTETEEIELKDMATIALRVLEKAEDIKSGMATVIALSGDLGAGKTTFTQLIAGKLGVKENIISPTFVIMKNYDLGAKYKWKKLIHIDAYRLDTSEELLKLGWEEIMSDKNNLILIEWPEQVPECIPENALKVELSHTKNETRVIKINP